MRRKPINETIAMRVKPRRGFFDFWRDTSGVSAVEYAVIISAIAAALMIALPTVGSGVAGTFDTISVALGNSSSNVSGGDDNGGSGSGGRDGNRGRGGGRGGGGGGGGSGGSGGGGSGGGGSGGR